MANKEANETTETIIVNAKKISSKTHKIHIITILKDI